MHANAFPRALTLVFHWLLPLPFYHSPLALITTVACPQVGLVSLACVTQVEYTP